MFEGQLIGIFIAARKRDALASVEQVEAIAGRGLVGDRYFAKEGSFSDKDGPDREATLIEIEALEALQRENDLRLEAIKSRRNLLTRGVPLNHLVGREFTIGDVLFHGLRLCEPCKHLEALNFQGLVTGLCHRGGLRARIVRGGTLRKGDCVRPVDKT